MTATFAMLRALSREYSVKSIADLCIYAVLMSHVHLNHAGKGRDFVVLCIIILHYPSKTNVVVDTYLSYLHVNLSSDLK